MQHKPSWENSRQPIQKLTILFATWKFIDVFTTARH